MSTVLPDLEPHRRRYWLDALIIAALALGLAFILLWQTMFVMIPAGSVGVLYRLFGGGTDTRMHLPEGVAVKWPWDFIYIYDVRQQARDMKVVALAQDGLVVDVEITVIYHPNPDLIGVLHRRVGPEYFERKVRPNIIEAVRQVIGQYDPHSLYTLDARASSIEMLERGRADLSDPAIVLLDLVIRRLRLPADLNEAITRKLTQEQYAQAYEYRLQSEREEAERKRIEAIGIQNFYAIVGNSLTPSLLTWRGIEATVELARSSNSKIVVVGGGKDQMPLILGSDIANLPPGMQPSPSDLENRPQLPDWRELPRLFPDTAVPTDTPPSEPTSQTGSSTQPEQPARSLPSTTSP